MSETLLQTKLFIPIVFAAFLIIIGAILANQQGPDLGQRVIEMEA